MLKILQARLQPYVTCELPDVQAGFRKGRGTRDQIANICWIIGEKAVAPHSSTLAWKIPWREEPGRLQSMGSLRVRHDWASSLSLFTFMHWRRKWQPTPVFLPGESQGRWGLVGCRLWSCTRVRHDWSDLAAAAAFSFCLFLASCWLSMALCPPSPNTTEEWCPCEFSLESSL